MPYDFPPAEQVQITTLYQAGPVANAPGGFYPMYGKIGELLEIPAQTDEGAKSTRAWFLTAAQANEGVGLYSIVIRNYSKRQAQLLGVAITDGVGPAGMQEASNQVARNVYAGLLNGTGQPTPWPAWRAPSIPVIAEADARAVGEVLFASLPAEDSALATNSSWAGAPLFGLLGSDESWRLVGTRAGEQSANTLEDWRNLLYAEHSFYHTFQAVMDDGGLEELASALWPGSATSTVACGDAWMGNVVTCLKYTLESAVGGDAIALPYFKTLTQFETECRQYALIESGYTGSVTTDANCDGPRTTISYIYPAQGKPEVISSRFRTPGLDLKTVAATYMAPTELRTLALSTGPVASEAKQALAGLSPFLISGGIAPSPPAALGSLSARYIQDRAAMLEARLAFDKEGARYETDVVSSEAFDRPTVFRDVATSLTLSVDVPWSILAGYGRVDFGTASADVFDGSTQADSFHGMDGNDSFVGNGGNDHFEGGNGFDTYTVTGVGSTTIVDSDGVGTITLNGNALVGGNRRGADVWESNPQRFTYTRVREGARLDLSVFDTVTGHALTIQGYNFSTPTLGIVLAGSSVAVPPTDVAAPTNGLRNRYDPGSPLADFIDTSSRPEYSNVYAAEGDDYVNTGPKNDRIFGGIGADSLYGGAGLDVVVGGPASAVPTVAVADRDLVAGGEGADLIAGGTGSDMLYADVVAEVDDGGNTAIYGDWINAGEGDDVVNGSAARDFVAAGAGRDVVFGGGGQDLILGDGDYDFTLSPSLVEFDNTYGILAAFHSWNGSAWVTQTASQIPPGVTRYMDLTPTSHFTWAWSTTDDDFDFLPTMSRPATAFVRVASGGENDVLHGGGGDDWIAGQSGADELHGGEGADWLFGDDRIALPTGAVAGSDRIYGDGGNDRIFGNALADMLYGGAGDDLIHGDDVSDQAGGMDTIYGGSGADEIYGHAGADFIYGEDGDEALLNGGGGDDFIDGGQGNDTLLGDGSGTTPGNDTLIGGVGNDVISGNGGHDVLRGGDGDDQLNGNEGNDALFGGPGSDVLSGGEGDDRYHVETGDDTQTVLTTITDSSGSNTLVFGGGIYPQRVSLNTSGSNLLVAYSDSDKLSILSGASGNSIQAYEFSDGRTVTHSDMLAFSSAAASAKSLMALAQPSAYGDYLEGTAGDDTISALGGADVVMARGGADAIDGGDGDDIIDAGAGNDSVVSGIGNDRVWGGLGDDVLSGGGGGDELVGNAGADELHGGDGNDLLKGGAGDDHLHGGMGSNTMYGGAGNNTFHIVRTTAGAEDVIDLRGYGGTQTISFAPGITSADVVDIGSTKRSRKYRVNGTPGQIYNGWNIFVIHVDATSEPTIQFVYN